MSSTQMLKTQRKQLPSYLVPLHQFLQNQRPSLAQMQEHQNIQEQQTEDQANKQDYSLNIKNINFKFFLPITKRQFQVYFPSLQSLSINHCDIRSLQNFPWLKRLTYLNLGFNHIQGGFNYLIPCKKLKHLNVESNLIFQWEKLKPIRKIRSQGVVQVCIKNNPFSNSQKQTVTSLTRNLKQYNMKVMKESKDASEWSASNSKSKSKKKSKSNQNQKQKNRSKQKKSRKLQRQHGTNGISFIQNSSSELSEQEEQQESKQYQIQKIQSCFNTSPQNNMGLRITFSGVQGHKSSTIHNGRQASDQLQQYNNQFNSFFTGRSHSNNHRSISHGASNVSRVIRFNNQGQDEPIHQLIRRRRIHPLNSSSNNQSTAARRAQLIRQIEMERQIFNMSRIDQDPNNIDSHLEAINNRYRRRNNQLRMDTFMRNISERRNQRNQRNQLNQLENTDLLSRPSLRINVSRTTGSDGNNIFSRIPINRGRPSNDSRRLQDPISSSSEIADNIAMPANPVSRVNLSSLQSSQSSHEQRNVIRPISSDESESQQVLDLLMNQQIAEQQNRMQLRVDLSQQGGNMDDDDNSEEDDQNRQENEIEDQQQQQGEEEEEDNQEEQQRQQFL